MEVVFHEVLVSSAGQHTPADGLMGFDTQQTLMSLWDAFIISNNGFGHSLPQKDLCSGSVLLETPKAVEAPFITYMLPPVKRFCGFRSNFVHRC